MGGEKDEEKKGGVKKDEKEVLWGVGMEYNKEKKNEDGGMIKIKVKSLYLRNMEKSLKDEKKR